MDTDTIVLLHNPRCSKSRQTLALLDEKGLNVEIREYLKHPLDQAELTALVEKLDAPASQLIREREAREAGFDDDIESLSTIALTRWLADHPKSLQRPIVITENAARIGRPPEAVLALFD